MRVRRYRYLGLFGLVFLVLAASLGFCYVERSRGWFSSQPANESSDVDPQMSSSGRSDFSVGVVSPFNIGITVILFILLAFSILNVYSFFNAQIDKEKAELSVSITKVMAQLKEVRDRLDSIEDRQNKDYVYERSFQRLISNSCPIYVRAAAAGHFLENEPRDTDLEVLKTIRAELPEDEVIYAPLVEQLKEVIETWGTDAG